MTDRISAAEDRMRGNRLETRMTATGAVGGGRGSEGGSVAAGGAFSRSRCKVGGGRNGRSRRLGKPKKCVIYRLLCAKCRYLFVLLHHY